MAWTSFAQSNGVQANVPFDFTVANQVLPAGTYSDSKTQSPGVIMIKNHDKPVSVFTLVNQDGTSSPDGGKLIFHRYDDDFLLSEILCDSASMNVGTSVLLKSREAGSGCSKRWSPRAARSSLLAG